MKPMLNRTTHIEGFVGIDKLKRFTMDTLSTTVKIHDFGKKIRIYQAYAFDHTSRDHNPISSVMINGMWNTLTIQMDWSVVVGARRFSTYSVTLTEPIECTQISLQAPQQMEVPTTLTVWYEEV